MKPTKLSPQEVRERGILELVNRRVLHPRGLALGVEGTASPSEGLVLKELAVYDYGEPVTYDDDGQETSIVMASMQDRSTPGLRGG